MTLAAYLCFAFVDVPVKWLVLTGLPAVQLAFMRYAPHFAISTLLLLKSGGMAAFRCPMMGLVLLRGALLASATLFNFITLNYLSLTITGAIMFSAPIIVCALSMPLLGERVGPWRWFAIWLGFAGVLVVIRPFGDAVHWIAILNVYNAFALALYSILTRKIAGIVTPQAMQFYMGAVGTVTTMPFALAVWTPPASSTDWALMVGIGVWGWAGHELFSRAHAFAPASTLMPYTYAFLIYLAIGGYVVFADLPDGWTLIGAAIIVVSGLIIWRRSVPRAATAAQVEVPR
ncbi:DMT family transporter [Thalassococcus sp. CAU 1522]|uniref:DMT family transporter n=2 Tax=Thalassococcus arenae TaxID=2851652 RepID=A0ABS6N647_9RHOB|nr:DMT family transporter [Thalassococcus arenae]MBV2359480.1 DMT family transporter [Thalassococcus arenae]